MAAEKKVYYATGRRKTSTARVFLKNGAGVITINGKKPEVYLCMPASRAAIMQPLLATGQSGKLDLNITVAGGGETGQSGAIRHAISRALVNFDETTKPTLKKAGYLTRDSRMVERKKYGKHGARKSTQFSKR
ncbi:MAG: 30S ribosomal protein S9 [Bdellovibrionaceae bacterium]|nr:30S ribosomal protein S9 [Pseudobdellovibrionaceae bacterium]